MNSLKTILIISIAFLCSCKQLAQKESPTSNFSWRNATVYFVYIDRFFNGDNSNDLNYGRKINYGSTTKNIATFHGGDITGLTKKLKEGYFDNLGTDVIWITGVYEQIHGWVGGGSKNDFPHYAYHGYYPFDFTQMDKNYGTIEELRSFIDLAHSKNIRIIMDAGLNHPGYHTLLDALQYNFGGIQMSKEMAAEHKSGLTSTNNEEHYNTYEYLSQFDSAGHQSWDNWWGYHWIRSESEIDKDILTESIFGLPDFKTESQINVNLPPVMKNKWATEGEEFQPWINPSALKYRTDLNIPPAEYLINWMTAWVEEFGIDGFRCDVLENVDSYRWKELKTSCNQALKKWRKNHSKQNCSNWTNDFWMTGDIWDADYKRYEEFANVGFNSVVNFTFPKNANLDSIGFIWQEYADYLNNDESWNTLSFLNNTYKRDTKPEQMLDNGTALILSPGAIQIFYGDEVARKEVQNQASDPTHGYRGDYIWNNKQQHVFEHWQKLCNFRNKHIAVGAGKQIQINKNTFVRSYNKSNFQDQIIICISNEESVSINLGKWFEEGTLLRNAYTYETSTVKDAKVTFIPQNKIVLIERAY